MKYKLIKEYPGSPSLNTLVSKHKNNYFYNFNNGSYKDEITTWKVEKYPEFWEEVIEKDYEILSFINDEKLIWNKAKDGRFDAKWQMYRPTEEDSLNEPGIDIFSVKRLSDGEVFTVGDKVKRNLDNYSFVITGFTKKAFNVLKIETNITKNSGGFWNIKDLEHIKKPLFTTEDGVDIFEGDGYWKVSANFKKSSVHSAKKTFRDNAINCTSKYFKNMLNAEEYILMNKPCLSISDVQNVLANYSTNLKSNLSKLVKLKL